MTYRDIGVAIGIPEPFSTELQTWRERLGDPNATRIPPHVTLLAPTALRTADLGRVEEHLQAIALHESPFRIHLRSSGTFLPVSPVVFVNLVEGISQCELLQERVRTGPLNRPLRFPYHPHVTVAHDLDDESWSGRSTRSPISMRSSTSGRSRCSSADGTVRGDHNATSRSVAVASDRNRQQRSSRAPADRRFDRPWSCRGRA